MPAISSNGTGGGNWSAAASWAGGVVPTILDDVTVVIGDTITLNTTGLICNSLVVNSGSTINASTTASSDITIETTGTFQSGSTTTIDLSSVPLITCTWYLNGAQSGDGYVNWQDGVTSCVLKGANRTRRTRLNGAVAASATSMTVVDATNWAIGDELWIGSTDGNFNTSHTENVQVTSVSGNIIGFTPALGFAHSDTGYVTNNSSNLTFESENTTTSYSTWGRIIHECFALSGDGTRLMQDVAFHRLGNGYSKYGVQLYLNIDQNKTFYGTGAGFINCAAHDFATWALQIRSSTGGGRFYVNFDGFVASTVLNASWTGAIVFNGGVYMQTPIKGITMLRMGYPNGRATEVLTNSKTTFDDCIFMGCRYVSISRRMHFTNSSILGNSSAFYDNPELSFDNCDLGTEFGCYNEKVFDTRRVSGTTTKNCTIQTIKNPISTYLASDCIESARVTFENKNNDVDSQEIYTNESYIVPTWSKDTTTIKRGDGSLKILGTSAISEKAYEIDFYAASGVTQRVVGYIQVDANYYNLGTWNPPTVEIMQGSTVLATHTATTACNGAWEYFDISGVQLTGVTQQLKIVITAKKAGSSGFCWVDGIPTQPIVQKARHYGFTFDEVNPIRTVDPYFSASETTAIAYTGVTLNDTTKEITFSAGTADTGQKFYDYSQAYLAANLNNEIAFTRAGGTMFLTTGWTVIDPTYTDIAWGNGTVQFTSTGTKTGSFDSVTFDFTVAGTYSMGGSSFSGTVELVNTSGGVVTVQLPTGVSYINTGPNITVELPVPTLTITGHTIGSTVVINDLDSIDPQELGTELKRVNVTTGDVTYAGASGNLVSISMFATGYKPYYQEYTIGSTDATFTIIPILETN